MTNSFLLHIEVGFWILENQNPGLNFSNSLMLLYILLVENIVYHFVFADYDDEFR